MAIFIDANEVLESFKTARPPSYLVYLLPIQMRVEFEYLRCVLSAQEHKEFRFKEQMKFTGLRIPYANEVV